MRQLDQLVSTEKTLAQNPVWGEPEDNGHCRFVVPIEVDGVIEAGLFLKGGTFLKYPERHVTLEVFYKGPAQRLHIGLGRLCWRTLDGGHTNKRRRGLPPDVSGKRIKGSHFHPFDLNWVAEERRPRSKGEMPFAQGFSEEFHTFELMCEEFGKLLKINNIMLVPRPDWVYDLFDGKTI